MTPSRTTNPQPNARVKDFFNMSRHHRTRYLRFLWIGLCLFSLLFVSVTSLAASPKAKTSPKVRTTKKPMARTIEKAKTLPTLAWKILDSSFHVGTEMVRTLLQGLATHSYKDVGVRLRTKWNAESLGRFASAYQYYINKLSEGFPKKDPVWKLWSVRTKQILVASKLVSESALLGKKKPGLKAALVGLSSWKATPLGSAPKSLQGKKIKLVLDAISGISTGIEFTSYYRLKQVETLLKTKPTDMMPLKTFLGSVKSYRVNFRRLRKAKSEKWMGLFVYHAELLFRSTVFLGRSVLTKGAKQTKMKKKYIRYSGMLLKSLTKANQSFSKFWRTK